MKNYKWKENPYLPLAGLFLICLFLRMFMTVNFNDDIVFSQIPQNDIIGRLRWNYYNWSTRLVIEFVHYNLYHLPASVMIWRCVDSLMMVLTAYSIGRIWIRNITQRSMTLICAVILLYPMIQMSGAGWIATSVNYTWPLALGLYVMTTLRHVYDDEKIKWWQHILYIAALVYASNAEQVVCVLIGFYVVMVTYCLVKRHCFPIILGAHLIIEIGMFLFKVTGPSNEIVNRTIARAYFPDYFALSVIEKATNTFASTCSHFVKYLNPVFLTVLILVCILVYIKYESRLYRFLATIPLVICLAVGVIPLFENSLLYTFSEFPIGEININNFNHFAEYMPIVCYLFIGADLLILFYLLWGESEQTILIQLLLVAGVASRMILTFSASIYASGTRTFAVMYFCLLSMIVFLWQELENMGNESGSEKIQSIKDKVYAGILLIAFLSVCNTWLAL